MFINIGGKKIWYEVYGAEYNETLLYLHGGPGASCLDFVNQARALSEKMRVVIFDQLGVLRSDAIAENESYGMEYQIDMVEEMRKLLGIEKWSILGHSYGGTLAVLYACAYPNSIHKIILECPSLCFEDSARSTAEYLSEHINSLNDKQATELCEKIKFADYQDKTEVVWDLSNLLGYVTDMELRFYLHGISFDEYQMSMDDSDIADEMWAKGERHLMKLLEAQPASEKSARKKVMMTDDFLPMIPKITAPMLLINGKYDPVCTKNQTEYVMSNAQNVTQVIFENSAHFPRLEEAEKYTDTVRSFLDGEISLCIMTKELCHELYKGWENDSAIYMDMDLFTPYQYNENAVNRYFDSKQDSSRILFAIMKDGRPIGELQLKKINLESKECTLSIHMQNDAVKGRGYGTCAERLALKYAFDVLGMAAVNADTVIKNARSQHVLEKVGFRYIEEKDGFKYYRYER